MDIIAVDNHQKDLSLRHQYKPRQEGMGELNNWWTDGCINELMNEVDVVRFKTSKRQKTLKEICTWKIDKQVKKINEMNIYVDDFYLAIAI